MGTIGAMGLAAGILLAVVAFIVVITVAAVRRGEKELAGKGQRH